MAKAREEEQKKKSRGRTEDVASTTRTPGQVWIRQSFREDGQPSSPVPASDQYLEGPLHPGLYQVHTSLTLTLTLTP